MFRLGNQTKDTVLILGGRSVKFTYYKAFHVSKFFRLIILVLLAMLAIPAFGFLIGNIVNIIFPYDSTGVGRDYNLWVYSIEHLHGMYLYFPIYFLPFYGITYWILRFFRPRLQLSSWALILVVVVLYFVYGYLCYGKQFWHLSYLGNTNKNIYNWLASEHKDLHFSIASLLSTFLYIYLVIKYILKKEDIRSS